MGAYAYLPPAVVDALPGLTPSAARIAVAVASFMGKSGECWPSRAALSQRSGVRKPHTIARALRRLADAGLLEIKRRPNRSSVYRWKCPLRARAEVPRRDTTDAPGSAPKGHAEVPPRGTQNSTKNKVPTPATRPPVWGLFVKSCRAAGRPDPAPLGGELGAARDLGRLVAAGEMTRDELSKCLSRYLADRTPFLAAQGHSLRVFSARLNAYRAAANTKEPVY